MADRYANFAELSSAEREGVDFRVRCTIRNPPVAIIAPHGGGIEPGTSEITSQIAGSVYSFYCFEGLKPSGNSVLHITSTRFDEPRCVDLVSASDFVVSVHGLAGTYEGIDVGGLDQSLREAICGSLVDAGFAAQVVTTGEHAAIDPANICNRGRRGAGVQLEITRALRDALGAQPQRMAEFANAAREAIVGETGDSKAGPSDAG
jgi:phage replication-related protein YjqB (UPF0714/DUF867 family)